MFSWQFKSWLLFPVYIVEGLKARMRQIRLKPAKGPISGHIEGQGAPIKLLVLGDSSVAGVGLDHTRNGLTNQLAIELNTRTKKPVTWRAAGANSATSKDICDYVLPYLPDENYSHIYISIGFNDLKNYRTAKAFKKSFGGLLYGLRTRYPTARIYWSNVMSPKRVPALSKYLAHVLYYRRQIINKVGSTMCNERTATHLPVLPGIRPEGFCRDGIHASPEGNKAWAAHVAELMMSNEVDEAE
ncbi:SGNH/GDSL hydrolase family protein [Polycladidibacter stylochi]|uniref:SGNH/GDSL hydrolase family protein n=1 Tax=Polycladidibacter stylochi TaxID=1807766 RepID=UPI000B2649D2|nr:SGNH/GDSL hydrolase family protein [Pseudovibrio stylochi]